MILPSGALARFASQLDQSPALAQTLPFDRTAVGGGPAEVSGALWTPLPGVLRSDGMGGSARDGGGGSEAAFSGSSTYDWPELHENPQLTGYAANSPLSTSNAGHLGVAWATDLYGAALDSPVVAYDSTLGETLAYLGTETGAVVAVNIADGQIVWGTWLGSAIRSTPLVNNGALFVGTDGNPRVFKLDASTGAVDCSVISPQPIEGTPTVATPPGGVTTVYVGTNDAAGSGPLLAVNAATCALEWQFTGYAQTSGTWTAAAYAVGKSGVPLVVFGTADPDSAVYAVNAVTGAKEWRFQTYNPSGAKYDVGAGAVISPPGANGFADGVAYVDNKDGIMYALDLGTGKQIWMTNFNQIAKTHAEARSTAALDGANLVFGYGRGVFDLNAVTGKEIWNYQDPSKTEALSSPAMAGSTGQEIVVVGDIGGGVDVLSLATGKQLYQYQTGSYITASPAVSAGNLLIASSDDFLYDFAVGGGNDAVLPTTSIATPVDASTVPNPDGDLVVTGTASDPVAVAGVEVAIQSGGPIGPWWDAGTSTWEAGPVDNPALVATPGTLSSSWTFSYPVPSAGGTYQVTAYTVSSSGQSDIHPAHVGFAVLYDTSGPYLLASSTFIAPGADVSVTGGGFADSEKIAIRVAGTILTNTTASATGTIASTEVPIPATAEFGQTSLEAAGLTSGDSATVAVTVENGWDQLGYDAGHSGFEPNDPILNDHVQLGSGAHWVNLAWYFNAGAAIDAAPAIADGVAYVVNTAGQLSAVDIHNGGLIWTWTLPSKTAIKGSPAVDPDEGLVLVAANDGTVDAVSASAGTLVWNTSVGGDLFAPVYGGGEVYVTSSTDHVTALLESTGKISWSTSLAGPITAAPALDPSGKVLVVDESNSHGDVIALSSTTGVEVWTYATGGAVAAAAMISGGVVYVGSADRSIYALKESTGTKLWSYKTGGAVGDTGALSNHGGLGAPNELLIGASNGAAYELLVSNGAQKVELSLSRSPIVGVSGVDGIMLMGTASGLSSAARSYVNLDLWTYPTGPELTCGPVVVDGTIYAVGNSNLYAFTTFGQPPV
jgi:outer membrane protein assembly factor BamB